MLELGEKSAVLHKEIGNIVFDCGVDILITLGKLSKWIARGAKEKGLRNSSVKDFQDKKKAMEFLNEILKDGDLVLVKGSRKMKLEDLVQGLKQVHIDQN